MDVIEGDTRPNAIWINGGTCAALDIFDRCKQKFIALKCPVEIDRMPDLLPEILRMSCNCFRFQPSHINPASVRMMEAEDASLAT